MNINLRLVHYLSIAIALFVTMVSCEKTEVIDNTEFKIFYSGLTDIGPSMTGIISSPTYKGTKPSEFEIVRITLDDVAFSSPSFEINPENGQISIRETSDLPVGHYKLTIACRSNGQRHEFVDVVEVNMMKPVPDGISVVPNKLTVDYGDVIDPTSAVELPTAMVTTDNNHVSIKKYEIASSEFSKYFAISSAGVISIVRGDATLVPGKYVLSLKLTTGASGEDKGIFENAIEINITSRPLALTYSPAIGKIEEESVQSGQTSYTSTVPVLKGSLEDLVYSIKSISPTTDKIKIDPTTGVLSVQPNHGLAAGQQFKVTVNVKNTYSPEGVDFADVFELQVVEFIEPIQNFSYANVDGLRAVAFMVSPSAAFKGDEVRFEFIDLPAALVGNVTLGQDGSITAAKGNKIPLDTYTVKVKATNPKSNPSSPTIATFTLTVRENPNYFTYIRYGNNLGLTPATNYANQFRIASGAALSSVSPTPTTDATVPLTYEIRVIQQGGGTTIDASSGKITLAGVAKKNIGIFMVTATAGKGTPAEYVVQTPVFFHYSDAASTSTNTSALILVEYSPFVMQVNPNTGGRSVKPTVTGVSDLTKFTMDHRRTFNYYNFFGSHLSGQPNVAGSFLSKLYDSYAASKNVSPNYGSRDPLSYYANVNALNLPLAYVDKTTLEMVVNPNKWTYEGEAANGVFIGQMTIEVNGADPQGSSGQIYPIALWFDTKF